ncbi:winged helix-turn-helix domain-containing protein [Streptomyces sp. DG2A-72]|uniref:winged helix-turn-helix domain-containing protein n=1 Tax=Streptomyces sp. DG2A-72 TaxID=3051386 RepID=UPI00265C5CD9|nr:winged helix-turn-helix domain-containing protein [Streptomyces sp. DG2A-72]MDO0934250.1 winged helix-turn-helix domain-containing protein [Streptomyces sp. DG2A-72]
MRASESDEGGGRQFRFVRSHLMARLRDGTYTVGARLKTQRELAEELAVSRETVQKVFGQLAEEGYIETRRGSGSVVVRLPGTRDSQGEPTLYDSIDEAFGEPEVSLDVVSLTSESLVGHFKAQVERVEARQLAPRRVVVRMMLPSEGADLLYPRAPDPKDDVRVRERWRNRVRVHVAEMGDYCERLQAAGVDTTLEVRKVRWTPDFKLYMFNDAHALKGLYIPVEAPLRLDDGTMVKEAIDVKGVGVSLRRFEKSSGADVDSDYDDYRAWFESHWKLVARSPKGD